VSDVVNLKAGLAQIGEPWVPTVVGELNGQYVKLGKAQGSYVWHHHENEDELFLTVQGALEIHLKDGAGAERVVTIEEGEFYIVPRGIEHKPVARDGEAHFLLFEPKQTRNTGNVDHAYTIEPEDLPCL